MPEPGRTSVRHIDMLRSVLASCLLVVLLSGCGNAPHSTGAGTAPEAPQATKIGTCPTDAPGVTRATVLARVDLDGDGSPDQVKLTAPEGSCPNVVFAKLPAGYVSAQVPTDGPPVRAAFGVSVPGRDGALLITQQAHPRGGFQLRAYAASADGLKELTYQDKPLFPFVATDVQQPFAVDCSGDKLVVTEAAPHEPHGVMFTWDVKQTAYMVHGDSVHVAYAREVDDNVPPAQLEQKHPELAGRTLFKSCRS